MTDYWCTSASLGLCVLINSLRLSDAYMRQWYKPSLVPIMACFLTIIWTKCWFNFNWIPGNKFRWNLYKNSHIFIHENAFENVVGEMVAILSRPQCVEKGKEKKGWCNPSLTKFSIMFSVITMIIGRIFFLFDKIKDKSKAHRQKCNCSAVTIQFCLFCNSPSKLTSAKLIDRCKADCRPLS